ACDADSFGKTSVDFRGRHFLYFPSPVRRHGQVVRQGPAKPLSPVRIRVPPPSNSIGDKLLCKSPFSFWIDVTGCNYLYRGVNGSKTATKILPAQGDGAGIRVPRRAPCLPWPARYGREPRALPAHHRGVEGQRACAAPGRGNDGPRPRAGVLRPCRG